MNNLYAAASVAIIFFGGFQTISDLVNPAPAEAKSSLEECLKTKSERYCLLRL